MNKQRTINQHYVPECLLKHFGYDGKKNIKRINLFDAERSVLRYNQSVKEVFSQNYFYDQDNKTENFISKYIETPASPIIDKIAGGDFEVIKEESLTLNRFILSLLYRTPEAIKRASEFVNSQIESVVREFLSLNGSDPDEASAGTFNFNNDRLASDLVANAVIDAVILRDLEYHIIKNATQLEFYISDHPVFIYNWLYRDLDHPEVTSLAARGLQIFLPLSPKITLCLYDPEVYKYGQKNLVSCIENDRDIQILNSFQIINFNSIIGFYSRESESDLKRVYEKYKNLKLVRHESEIRSIKNNQEQEEIKSTHLVFTRQTQLRKMPSFVKIKKKSKGYASSYQERDSELSKMLALLK